MTQGFDLRNYYDVVGGLARGVRCLIRRRIRRRGLEKGLRGDGDRVVSRTIREMT